MTENPLSRRSFVKGVAAVAGMSAAGGLLEERIARAEPLSSFVAQRPAGFTPMEAPGRVVRVTAKGDLSAVMQKNQRWPKLDAARKLFEKAMMEFTGASNAGEAMKRFVHPSDLVAVKVNGIAAQTGYAFGTNYELVLAVVEAVLKAGVPPEQVTVFEQYPSYLIGCRVDTRDWKLPDKVQTDSHNNKKMKMSEVPMYQGISTKYCTVFTDATAVINMPLLKDHSLCGFTGALKNITHGVINNPQAFHVHQASPQIAMLYNHPVVRSRVRLHVTDGFRLMYDGGPLGRNPRAQILHGSVYVATDPVALDTVGAKLLDEQRTAHKLPTFKQGRREPRYIKTAGELGLGVHELNAIRMQGFEV